MKFEKPLDRFANHRFVCFVIQCIFEDAMYASWQPPNPENDNDEDLEEANEGEGEEEEMEEADEEQDEEKDEEMEGWRTQLGPPLFRCLFRLSHYFGNHTSRAQVLRWWLSLDPWGRS